MSTITAGAKRVTARSARAAAKQSAPRPRRRKPGEAADREEGPHGWLDPVLESAYTKLVPREQAPTPPPATAAATALAAGDGGRGGGVTRARAALGMLARAMPGGAFASTLQPHAGEAVLAPLPQELWIDRLAEYKRRKAAAAGGAAVAAVARALPGFAAGPAGPPGPVVPGQRNWAPLGPSVVMNGQAQGLPPVGGRVAGIAVAPGGQRVYAASANGGVFRSDDGGVSWRSLMDAFDVDPTQFASTSLACGAIAIDAKDPDRIYVGTGEGDTYAMFASRLTNALPAYRGIGPIRSDDGGRTWVSEPSAAGSPTLAGKAFFALAVDPSNRENVVGATSEGLYQRLTDAAGKPSWTQRKAGVFASVVASVTNGATRFYAAQWGKGVLKSTDGEHWTTAGTGFPSTGVGRIALGVRATSATPLYAMVASTTGGLAGVYRLDGTSGAWKRVTTLPDVLPQQGAQGDYDLAIAVDPSDANTIYLGGSFYSDQQFWPASIWRCTVQPAGAAYKATGASIGVNAHSDVHTLVHTPGDKDALWVGCDGGVFLNRDPRGTGAFKARNNGLACLCTNYFAQHPTDPGVLFCGLQDNGTARASGGAIWNHVNWGDGGYCLINWANPKQVLVFANGTVYRATDGGQGHGSWTYTEFDWAMMTEPIVGVPYDPAQPNDAKLVALGAGRWVYLSTDFGATWQPTPVALPITGGIYAMAFASRSRIFVGTTQGQVFRADKVGATWQVVRLDDVAAGPLALHGLVADIAVDWGDPARASIYVAFGGTGDYRHVWHFDGTRWEARSGAAAGTTNLLDVEHNAIVVDPVAPSHVYVGADIGAWHSPDRGQTWQPLPNGLPDAPVFDLQIHPTRRLLRASTHGRGLYELKLE